MQVEFVMVADAAQVVGGKLYVLGGAWNQYRCAAFPAQVSLAIIASILVETEETGRELPVVVVLAGEDGIPILPEAQANLQVGRVESARGPHRALFTLSANVQIPRAGRYTAQVTAGDARTSVWFDVFFAGKTVAVGPSGTEQLH